jgi:hypothetical protein
VTSGRPDTYAELRLAEGKLLGWDERKTGGPCALQPRDAEILTALARYRFLTTAQVSELWWQGRGMRAVRRRLTRLFEAGLVERFRPQTLRGAFQWTYCLARDGFCAAEQSGALPEGLKFTPRRERLFDYRYVVHDLRVNEWAIRYRDVIGDGLVDWAGPDESRVEPPRRLPETDCVPGSYHSYVVGLDRDAVRPIQPDARLSVAHASGELLLFVEYDRTRRLDKNYDKFRRYETFLSWWWELTELRRGQRPALLVICQDDDHRRRFLRATDTQLVTHISEGGGSDRCVEYPARDRILFALEEDIRGGKLEAVRLPPEPPGHERDEESAFFRRVRVPGSGGQRE